MIRNTRLPMWVGPWLLTFVLGVLNACAARQPSANQAESLNAIRGVWRDAKGQLLVVNDRHDPVSKRVSLEVSAWQRLPRVPDERALWAGSGEGLERISLFVPLSECVGKAAFKRNGPRLDATLNWEQAEREPPRGCPVSTRQTWMRADVEALIHAQIHEAGWFKPVQWRGVENGPAFDARQVQLAERASIVLRALVASEAPQLSHDILWHLETVRSLWYDLRGHCAAPDDPTRCTDSELRAALSKRLPHTSAPPPRAVSHGLRDAGGELWLGERSQAGDDVSFAGLLEVSPGGGTDDGGVIASLLAKCPDASRLETCSPPQLRKLNEAVLADRRATKRLRFSPDLPYQLVFGPDACEVLAVRELHGTFPCMGDGDRQIKVERRGQLLIVRPLGNGWNPSYPIRATYTLYPSVAAPVMAEQYAKATANSDLGSAGGRILSLDSRGAARLFALASDAIANAGFDINTVSFSDMEAVAGTVHSTLLFGCHIADLSDLTASPRCDAARIARMTREIAAKHIEPSLRLWLCGESVHMDATQATCSRIQSSDDGRPIPAAQLLTALRHMDKLTELHLNGLKELSTDPGLDSLEPITQLPALRFLDAGFSGITDLSPLRFMHKLENLGLAGNPVHDLAPLSQLHQLQSLVITNTQVTTLAPLRGLRALAALDISQTAISDIGPLAELPALKGLKIVGSVAFDVSRDKLEALIDVEYKKGNYEAGPALTLAHQLPISLKPLANSNITDLVIMDSRVAELSSLASLDKLHTLTLRAVGLESVPWLAGLTGLRGLDLGENPLRRIDEIRSLTNLEALLLAATRVTDFSPMLGLSKLGTVALNKTVAPDLMTLSKLPNLRVLSLAHAKKVDLAPIAKMEQLQELDLTGAEFTNLGSVCGAKELRRLRMHRLDAIDFAQLQQCLQLEILSVDRELFDAANSLHEQHLPKLKLHDF